MEITEQELQAYMQAERERCIDAIGRADGVSARGMHNAQEIIRGHKDSSALQSALVSAMEGMREALLTLHEDTRSDMTRGEFEAKYGFRFSQPFELIAKSLPLPTPSADWLAEHDRKLLWDEFQKIPPVGTSGYIEARLASLQEPSGTKEPS